ncbi:MAG TPA: hypothetical protein VJ553_07225 [Candidatus Paceibacterota bacterium]|nr:hypothetical protein [Candidatus Paceibacterota bacterium]
MRIKPWVVTLAAAVTAAAAVAVVVTSTDPAEADPQQFILVWTSLAASLWAALVTLFLWGRMNLTQAVWIGALWTLSMFCLFILTRAGINDRRLLGGILFVTLFLSFVIWRHFRHGRT